MALPERQDRDARFYAEHVLPEAEAWRLEITAGAASTLALAEASF